MEPTENPPETRVLYNDCSFEGIGNSQDISD